MDTLTDFSLLAPRFWMTSIEWMNGRMDGRMDERMDERMNRGAGGQMGGQVNE